MTKYLTLSIALFIFLMSSSAQTVPQWQWAKVANDPGESMCNSIATDPAGNAYVVGTFTGTLDFGTTTLTSTGDSDIFFAKYDAGGNLLWAKHEGGPGGDQGFGIAVDTQGNIYVAGTFYQTIVFDTFSFTSNGFADLCLAKYDNNGNLLWAKAWGSIYEDLDSKIFIDKNNDVLLTGMFAGDGASPPSHGTISFDNITLTSAGGADVFILKLNNSGNTIWAKQAGGVFEDFGIAIYSDFYANVYVTGNFTAPSIHFDNVQLNAKVGPFQDMFITKYDSNGNALWAKGAGGDFPSDGAGIAVDSNGYVYVTGSSFQGNYIKFDNNITISNDKSFIAKYDTTGNIVWAKPTALNSRDFTQGMVSDNAGHLYTIGFFYDQAIFGADTLNSVGNTDISVCKYDYDGNIICVKQAGGISSDAGYSLRIDNQDNILVAGYISSQPADFDALQISATQSWDPFVAKLSNPLAVQNIAVTENKVLTYPNPADDILYIRSADKIFASVKLVDITGRVLRRQFLTQKNTSIDLKTIPPGLYYLQLAGNTNTITKKIIVQH
jgi:hypothetical protein